MSMPSGARAANEADMFDCEPSAGHVAETGSAADKSQAKFLAARRRLLLLRRILLALRAPPFFVRHGKAISRVAQRAICWWLVNFFTYQRHLIPGPATCQLLFHSTEYFLYYFPDVYTDLLSQGVAHRPRRRTS